MCKVRSHFRRSHCVRGHFRNTRNGRKWVPPHERCGTIVNGHCLFKSNLLPREDESWNIQQVLYI